MKNKSLNIGICLLMFIVIIFLPACNKKDSDMNQIERNWSQEGAWSKVYVYKGKGELLSMMWKEKEQCGSVVIKNSDLDYDKEYISLYKNDPNWKLISNDFSDDYYESNNVDFESLDGKLSVRIVWGKSLTMIFLQVYE